MSEIRITISYENYMRTHMRSLLVSITISYEISYVYRSATAKLCPCHAKLERQHRSCHDKTQSFCGTSKYRAKHCPNRYQLCHSEALPSYGCVMSDGHVKLDIDCLPPYVESSKHQQEKKILLSPKPRPKLFSGFNRWLVQSNGQIL